MEQMVDEITIANEKVRMDLQDVNLAEVHLDEANPRIRYRFGLEQGSKTLQETIMLMPEVKSLRKDIKYTGGLRERVILRPDGDGGYTVVEGNCRTACYISLHGEDENDPRWQTIPARVLPIGVEARKTAILLSDLHVGGKIAWNAHEKAGHVYTMANDLGMKHDEIAMYMRQSKSTVGRFLAGYTFMVERFFTVDGGKYAKIGEGKWSYFDELFRSVELRTALKDNPAFGDDFCRWVGDGRIPTGADVRKLASILRHPKARKTFEAADPATVNPVAEAMKLVEDAEPEQGSDFFKLLAKVRENCTSAAQVREILKIRTDKVARQRLWATYEAMKDFMRLADLDPDAEPEVDQEPMPQAAE